MKFPKAKAQAVLAWMNEQMYGDLHTEWTNGNEHDRMREAADFLQGLCKEKMLKRVCSYSVFKSSRPETGGRSWVYPSAQGESTAALLI